MVDTPDIDLVYTWVDGRDPEHQAKRQRFKPHCDPEKDEAFLERRWVDQNELAISLDSVARHAPWVRKIWIITDDQQPDLSTCPAHLRPKIAIISHREIFRDYEQLLPTFNSVSIETMMWRIAGLAEHFIYLNDDFFFINRLTPSDFFVDDRPILRGRWKGLEGKAAKKFFGANLHRGHKLNAARLVKPDLDRIFSQAHVATPLCRSVFEDYFRRHPEHLIENARHRFRVASQFHLPSLGVHLEIAAGSPHYLCRRDWFNFSSRWCQDRSPISLALLLAYLRVSKRKLLCVNDLAALERTSSRARPLLEWICK